MKYLLALLTLVCVVFALFAGDDPNSRALAHLALYPAVFFAALTIVVIAADHYERDAGWFILILGATVLIIIALIVKVATQ